MVDSLEDVVVSWEVVKFVATPVEESTTSPGTALPPLVASLPLLVDLRLATSANKKDTSLATALKLTLPSRLPPKFVSRF